LVGVIAVIVIAWVLWRRGVKAEEIAGEGKTQTPSFDVSQTQTTMTNGGENLEKSEGRGVQDRRGVVFQPWVIQADKPVEGGRFYEKVWYPEIVAPVLTPDERASYLAKWDRLSAEEKAKINAQYGMTNELRAILTGGDTEPYITDKRIEFAIEKGYLTGVPKEKVMRDPAYKAYYDWWENVIASQNAKIVQEYQEWLVPQLQKDVANLQQFYQDLTKGVWIFSKTVEGKTTAEIVSPKYLATPTPAYGGRVFVKTEAGTVTMTKKEYAAYAKEREARESPYRTGK